MNTNMVEVRPMVGAVRWVARVIVTLTLVFAWFIAIGSAVNDPSLDPVGIALVVGLILITLVAALAWFQERLGGVILIGLALVGGIFAYLESTPNNVGAGLMVMLPWLVSGILFIVAGRLDAEHSTPAKNS